MLDRCGCRCVARWKPSLWGSPSESRAVGYRRVPVVFQLRLMADAQSLA